MKDLEKELLIQRGWKPLSTNYIKKWKKEGLIEYIRILEHNWSSEIFFSNKKDKRLENVCNYLKSQSLSLEKINEIIFNKGENL